VRAGVASRGLTYRFGERPTGVIVKKLEERKNGRYYCSGSDHATETRGEWEKRRDKRRFERVLTCGAHPPPASALAVLLKPGVYSTNQPERTRRRFSSKRLAAE